MTDHRHAWVLTVLPPDCGRVLVVGNPGLAHTLDRSGFEVMLADDDGPCDVVLASDPAAVEPGSSTHRPEARVVAVDLRPDPRWAHQGRPGRLTQAAVASRLERRARTDAHETAQRWDRAGWTSRVVTMGNQFAPTVLADGPLAEAPLRDRPLGPIVVATRPGENGAGPASTLVGAALAEAGHQLGPLDREGQGPITVLESGKLLIPVRGPGARPRGGPDRLFVRLGLGGAGALIDQSLAALNQLGASPHRAPIDHLVPWPRAQGRVGPGLSPGSGGPARWVAEPRLGGDQPAELSPTLWDQCLGFLAQLHAARAPEGGTGADDVLAGQLQVWTDRVAAFVPPDDVAAARRLAETVAAGVAGLPLGFGHGDLWLPNLLVDGGELTGVVDWDWASPDGLPLLDALELWAMSTGSPQAETVGPRTLDLLWPAAADPDRRIRDHARSLGLEPNPGVLRPLVAAYWLQRVFRDLRPYSPRPAHRGWFEANVVRPVRVLSRELTP